jgi:hypothetical protein
MANRKVFFFSASILFIAGLGSGCASTSFGWRPQGDTRGMVTVDQGAPRLLLVGPARLMHVHWLGQQTLSVYTVAGARGTDADCAQPALGSRAILRTGAANHLDLNVEAGQAICLAKEREPIAAMASQRPMRASWHARQPPANDPTSATMATQLARN